MNHDLSHLTQNTTEVFGPIQDDEALFLYSLIRCMGLKYIVEVGGLHGYSARNFLKAINNEGVVVTIDPHFLNFDEINKILTPDLNLSQHVRIIKYAHEIVPQDLPIPRIDLIFFDAHDYDSQMSLFNKCVESGLISNRTIVALHDTGTCGIKLHDHHIPLVDQTDYNSNYGFYHGGIPAERQMSNTLMDLGYSTFHVSANQQDLPSYIKIRHGLTILHKSYKLIV